MRIRELFISHQPDAGNPNEHAFNQPLITTKNLYSMGDTKEEFHCAMVLELTYNRLKELGNEGRYWSSQKETV